MIKWNKLLEFLFNNSNAFCYELPKVIVMSSTYFLEAK